MKNLKKNNEKEEVNFRIDMKPRTALTIHDLLMRKFKKMDRRKFELESLLNRLKLFSFKEMNLGRIDFLDNAGATFIFRDILGLLEDTYFKDEEYLELFSVLESLQSRIIQYHLELNKFNIEIGEDFLRICETKKNGILHIWTKRIEHRFYPDDVFSYHFCIENINRASE